MQVSLNGRNVEKETPVGFTWSDHPLVGKITKNIDTGEILVDFDVSTLAPSGSEGYVDVANGNDTNSGLTSSAPLKTLRAALNKGFVVIHLAGGLYERNQGFYGTLTQSVSVKSYNGTPILSLHDSVSWTLDTTYTNTYKTTKANASSVYDALYKDAYGDNVKLVLRAIAADVDANPGSYYIDTGTNTVYVRLQDSRVPDSNVRVYVAQNNTIQGGITCYFEGAQFEGGGFPLWAKNTDSSHIPNVYLKNCKAKYGVTGNTVRIEGSNTIFQDCEAARGTDDGFNYHSLNGVICKAIEINCVGRDNGITGDNDNGSTIHDGGKIIRINGKYYRNAGPNVADVTDGTQSWNLGCVAYGSKGASGSGQNTDFQVTTGLAEAWYDSCVGYGSDNSLNIGDAASKAYVKDSKLTIQTATGKKFDY